LSGVPYFNGYYLIDSVDFDLAGEQNRLMVSASTALDPEKTGSSKSSKSKKSKSSSSKTSIKEKTSSGAGKRHYPLSRKYKIGTPYGRRGNWAAGYHTGADFPAPTGAAVYAVYNGTISIGGWGSAYGKHVRLKVSGKGQYGYCHLSRISVRSGQSVKAGQRIGYVGSTGRAFGSHLHLEKRVSPYRYGKDSRNPMS
jgi:murein DD-endopeptidase MepM/ murein hydrolase activator NlpD